MLFKEYLQKKSQLIENYLATLIEERNVPYRQLFTAARYSLLGGGKRLRPILLLASIEALNGNSEHALSVASALEMVHTYSLIHDDLPCMDDDDFRRGKPSLHKAFSEAHAVLTGDFLLSHAFEIIADERHLNAEQKVALIGLLAKSCGGNGMIAGQVMDIEAEGKSIDQETLQRIHRHKTGALITASVKMGGIVAHAQKQEMDALEHYGNAIGLAFQIVDDILDVSASVEKHGKTTSSDMANNKTTYVTLLGIDKAQAMADQLVNSAKQHLQPIGSSAKHLCELADYITIRKH
jgi:geranylgeranyl diphosphate synthase, type II